MYFKIFSYPLLVVLKIIRQKFNIQLLYNQVMSQRGKQQCFIHNIWEMLPRVGGALYFRIWKAIVWLGSQLTRLNQSFITASFLEVEWLFLSILFLSYPRKMILCENFPLYMFIFNKLVFLPRIKILSGQMAKISFTESLRGLARFSFFPPCQLPSASNTHLWSTQAVLPWHIISSLRHLQPQRPVKWSLCSSVCTVSNTHAK